MRYRYLDDFRWSLTGGSTVITKTVRLYTYIQVLAGKYHEKYNL